jgi:hypothetical protein
MSTNLNETLQKAVKEVPLLRYAYGVIGLVATVVLIKNMSSDPRLVILGSIGLIFGMITFILLERAATAAQLPAKVFLWFSLLLMMSVITVLAFSAIFNKPDLGIYETLFKRKVNTILERIADKKVVESLQNLPPEGIDLIMDAGDKYMTLAARDPRGKYYFRSSKYNSLVPMSAAGIVTLKVPPSEFNAILSKLRPAPEYREDNPIFVVDSPLSEEEERQLLDQGYTLSKDGLKVYNAIIEVAKEQIK